MLLKVYKLRIYFLSLSHEHTVVTLQINKTLYSIGNQTNYE